ncbi:PLP-dependent aminotransferase family protein [Actinacidiphila oryziradicis]|uniref:MocR-like pyridoxine biosynthesis transcription factor PdxR n=1 Tax=Actinacidiphila oryziradicis TaxID=2571141 RepID=UPI0023F2B4BA|nr:PLP-dependent aminotransferase family protein [Actinacidiphila oryziradicis]
MNPWANSGSDLHLHLDLSGPGSIRAALVRALRDAVRTGRLTPGTRLPPSRSFAADLGLARNTVAAAYAELVAEGWLTARQGAGTRVARRAAVPPRAYPPAAAPRPELLRLATAIDVSAFPRTAWIAATRRALTAAPSEAFGYGDSRGRPELRHALADYLARARGVRTDPERIVICSGFAGGLALLARVLKASGARRAAVESYGLAPHRDLFTAAGLRTLPLPVDEYGARTDELSAAPDVRAALLTPAHQYPTGVTLHPDRRAAVIDWARTTTGIVLEDDYDGEFRYDRQPVGALQGLAPDHVVYLGTSSKSLTPALRLAWMALPGHLLDKVLDAKGPMERHCSALDQLTLAEFITSGAYDRHVRAMRLRYRRRRDLLVAALAPLTRRVPHIRLTGIAAGLHLVLRLPPGTERPLVHAMADDPQGRHLPLGVLRDFHHGPAGHTPGPADGAVVVGYGAPPEHAFTAALDALCRTLDALTGTGRA